MVIDEVLSALDDDAHKRVINLLNAGSRMPPSSISAGPRLAKNHFFKRVLHLIKDPQGRCFIPDLSVTLDNQPRPHPRPFRSIPSDDHLSFCLLGEP